MSENSDDQAKKTDAGQQWLDNHPRANLVIGWAILLVAAAAVVGIVIAISGTGDNESNKPAAAQVTSTPSPSPTPTVDVAALRNELVAQAEAAVLAELPDAPIWEGITAKGRYVSDTEVCVDRTFGPTGGMEGKGGNAGYVVVTFPGVDLGEPQDGKCASAESEPTAETVEVSAAFQDDPGLVTRDDLGDEWPLTVDFGALDCRTTVIDGVTLQSVTFRVPNMQYALNGTAKTHTPFPDIDPIWADDPDVDGLKIGIGPLIERGLARCG